MYSVFEGGSLAKVPEDPLVDGFDRHFRYHSAQKQRSFLLDRFETSSGSDFMLILSCSSHLVPFEIDDNLVAHVFTQLFKNELLFNMQLDIPAFCDGVGDILHGKPLKNPSV